MAGMAIPPAIVRVLGTIDTLINKIAEAKALLEAFASQNLEGPEVTPTLTHNLATQVAKYRTELHTLLTNHPIDIPSDLKPPTAAVWATKKEAIQRIASANPIELRTELVGFPGDVVHLMANIGALDTIAKAHPIQIPATVNWDFARAVSAAALAHALEPMLALAAGDLSHQYIPGLPALPPGGHGTTTIGPQGEVVPYPMPNWAFGGGGEGSTPSEGSTSSLFGSIFGSLLGAGHAAAGSSIGQAIWSFLYKAGGSGGGLLGNIPGLSALPGGVLPAAAGLGSESLIIGPLLGLIGSMIGGAIGGGTLLAGGVTTAGVGLLTNALGGQAFTEAMQLHTITQQYRTGKITAATYQRQYQGELSTIPAKDRTSVIALQKAITGLGTTMNKVAIPSVEKAAGVFTRFFNDLTPFLDSMGRFASKNWSTITKSLRPFFHWMDTTGLRIFNNIESTFSKNEGHGIKAVTGALKLFLQVITGILPDLGTFVTFFANEFAKLTTKTKGHVKSFVATMVSDFNAWLGFFKQAFDLFKAALPNVAHLGKGIVTTILTPILQSLTTLINNHKGLFKEFFTTHKGLILTGVGGIIKSLMPLVDQMTLGFMNLAIALRPLTTAGLEDVANVIHYIDTLLMTIAKLITGKISVGGAVTNITGHPLHQHPTPQGYSGLYGPTQSKFYTHISTWLFHSMPHALASAWDSFTSFFTGTPAGASTFHHKKETTTKAQQLGQEVGHHFHQGVVSALKSTTIAKNFTAHLAHELTTTSKPITLAASRIGTTDIHQVIWKNLKADILGRTFDQHLAQAITKTKTIVTSAAYSLGVAARKAYVKGAAGGQATTGHFNPGRNNPGVYTHPHAGR